MGASTSREPANFPEGVRGEVSTSTATDAAELDALYHDLPTYQPEPADGKEAEGIVVTEPISLPTPSVSEKPSMKDIRSNSHVLSIIISVMGNENSSLGQAVLRSR